MASAGPTPYSTHDAAQDAIDRMSKRLTGDIRSKIRRIAPPVQPMTEEWLEQLCYIQHLATVAATEERESFTSPEQSICNALATTGNSESGGSVGKSGHETVWEKEDVCVRLVIEEGKTNLLVRTLIEYWKAFHQVPGQTLVPAVQRFETAFGILVRCSLAAYEALQTLDTRAVLDHCAATLRLTLQEVSLTTTGPSCMLLLSQSGVVIAFLAQIVANMERLRCEDAIFSKLMDLDILNLVLNHVEWAGGLLFAPQFQDVVTSLGTLEGGDSAMQRLCPYLVQRDFPANYIIFLTALLRSEGFKTNLATFLPTKESKKRVATTAEKLLKMLSAQHLAAPEVKKAMRPLTDFILRFK